MSGARFHVPDAHELCRRMNGECGCADRGSGGEFCAAIAWALVRGDHDVDRAERLERWRMRRDFRSHDGEMMTRDAAGQALRVLNWRAVFAVEG